MSEIGLLPEYRIWQAAGHQIEYPRAVLDEIRLEATEGYCRLPHGGVEVGGVLFGLKDRGSVRIVTHRPVPCEYKRGPSYLLSENDEDVLAATIESVKTDTSLDGLQPVGWYHSHTRQEICLTPADIELYDRFFPEPWQIAMVMRPASLQPTRAGFFFREGDGSVRVESSYREFTVGATEATDAAGEEPADETSRLPAVVDMPVVKIETLPALSPRTLTVVSDNGHVTAGTPPRRLWKWYAAFAALILANAVLVWWWLGPARQLSLAAADSGGQLQIRWNERAVRDASGGSLEIVDGGDRAKLNLETVDLRSGRLAYRRKTGDVLVHMTVRRSGRVIEEATRFLDPRWSPAAASVPPPLAAKAVPKPVPALTTPKPPVTQAANSLPQVSSPPSPPPQASHSQPPEEASPQPHAPGPQPPALPPPDLAAPGGRIETAKLPAVPPPAMPEAPKPPLPKAPLPQPPAPKPAEAAPASGKLFWTGRLGKDGMLMLAGGRASTGSLSGALPGRPVRIRVYPADSAGQTATLYSADPKYAHKLIERPGPETGNRKFVYTWDPLRARSVTVLEPPASQNGWTHLVMHAERNVTALVVEWSTVP